MKRLYVVLCLLCPLSASKHSELEDICFRYIRAYSGRLHLDWGEHIRPSNLHSFLSLILPDNPLRSYKLDDLITDLYNFSVYGGKKPEGSYKTMELLMDRYGFIKVTTVNGNLKFFREKRNKK